MCSNPQEVGEFTVACRKCNECINTRKNDWVARAMAESATAKHTLAITLTYADDTQERRDGATVFRYQDIREFLARIRRQVDYHLKRTGAVRFIVAGENGSKKGRVHWHMIIFSEVDLLKIGKFKDRNTGKQIKDADEIIENRVHWSMWKHGFVYPQQPDQGGVAYVLKYAIKDTFNVVNSAGTMRISQSEHYSASYFRMSKTPPIGAEWLYGKLETLRAKAAVPISLNLKVPGYTGYWYPNGPLRQYMLNHIWETNFWIRQETGKNAPQWSALLASVEHLEKEKEFLTNGPEKEEMDPLEWDYIKGRININAKEKQVRDENARLRARCGGSLPCYRCQQALSSRRFEEAKRQAEQIFCESDGNWFDADQAVRKTKTINPYCMGSLDPRVIRAFS